MRCKMSKLLKKEDYMLDYVSRAACDEKVLNKIQNKVDELDLFGKVSFLDQFEYYEERAELDLSLNPEHKLPMKELYNFNICKDNKDAGYVTVQVYPVTNTGTVCLNLFAMVTWRLK